MWSADIYFFFLPFTLDKILKFKNKTEVYMKITQTNLFVSTLRRVLGTTPCFPAAFSAFHQPSSLELTTKNNKDFQNSTEEKLHIKSTVTSLNPSSIIVCFLFVFFRA